MIGGEVTCTARFGQFIGSIGPIEEKKTRRKQNDWAVMGVEQTTKITTVYI
jgi:hypothetical protein